jgi:hypothetical protein
MLFTPTWRKLPARWRWLDDTFSSKCTNEPAFNFNTAQIPCSHFYLKLVLIYSAVHSCTLILLWNDTKEWMFQVFLKVQIASIVAVEWGQLLPRTQVHTSLTCSKPWSFCIVFCHQGFTLNDLELRLDLVRKSHSEFRITSLSAIHEIQCAVNLLCAG